MTTERSTYTYDSGAQETVTLRRNAITPRGHALLKIEHSSGLVADCYVDLAWLRDRADQLARQRPEGAEDIEALVEESLSGDALSDAQVRALADFLAARLTDPTVKDVN